MEENSTNHSFGEGDDEESQTHSSRSINNKILNIVTPLKENDDDRSKESNEKNQQTSLLVQKLGLIDFVSIDVWRASVAELLGTAVLVFVLDTIVISTFESETKMPNLIMSILIAFFATIIILAVFPISGGHMNPIITFAGALVGIISMSRAVVYMAAQCIGAVIGSLALKAVVSDSIQQTFSLGGCTVRVVTEGPNGPETVGIGVTEAFWMEFFCSFSLLFSVLWMAYDFRHMKVVGHIRVFAFVGIMFGILVFVSSTVTKQKGYGGAGMNPAKCLGAALVKGGHLWDGLWVFWVAPCLACVVFYMYTKLIPREHFHAEGYPYDLFDSPNLRLDSCCKRP